MYSAKLNKIPSVESPCVRNCCLNQNDVCLGCGRTIDEITSWTQQSDQQKQQTLAAAKQRLDKLTNNLV